VEPLAARAALFAWQLVGCGVEYGVADVALLDALEVLVHIPLPQAQAVHQRTVLPTVTVSK